MLFCILQDPKTYDDIKRKAAFDLPVSVPTQVMLAKKAFNPKGVDQYAGNLLLKVCRSADGYRDAAESSPYPARPRAGECQAVRDQLDGGHGGSSALRCGQDDAPWSRRHVSSISEWVCGLTSS